MTKHRRLGTLLMASLAMVFGAPALPQAYPARAVTIVVPFPAGGSPDVFTRIVSEKVSANWGVPVVVEARPSAGGSIGAAHVARSPADGYTLLLATLSHVTNPGLTAGKSTWHPADDFSGIVELVNAPVVALVPASLPVRTLKEFVE